MRYMTILAAAAAVAGLILTACASQHPTSHANARPSAAVSSPSASPSAPPGPERFLEEFRADVPALATAPDAQILKIGQDECNYFAAGGSYTGMVLTFMKAKSKPTTQQATILVDSAVRNLCPKYSNLIPAGAP